MATLLQFRDFLRFACILFAFQDLCSGAAIWQFNGTKTLLPTENNVHEVQLFQKLVFYQNVYSKLYITKDGLVGFSRSTSYQPVDYSARNLSPFVKDPFISPYHYDGESIRLVQDYTGRITYQQYNLTSSNNRNPEKLSVSWLGQYVRSQIVGGDQFHPDWALEVTWSDVTSVQEITQGSCKGTKSNPCATNTFQLVLLSDGTNSYAIFNYGSMDINPRQFDQVYEQCRFVSNLFGNHIVGFPTRRPIKLKAGFFGGQGPGWYGVFKEGLNGNKSRLTTQQGSNTPGRYIFKISSANIVRGGCSNNPDTNKLSVNPTHAGLFGGEIIDVSGPCIKTNNINDIKCRFGQQSVSPIKISTTKVRCVVPHLSVRGRIKLSLSVDGGRTYPFDSPFTVVIPERLPKADRLSADDGNIAWYGYNANQIAVRWSPEKFTNTTSAMVDISLIGYRETADQVVYTKLQDLGSTSVGSGRFMFSSNDKLCSDQNCFDYHVGLFEVRLRDPGMATKRLFIASKPVPIGWYVRQAMESRHGNNWQSALCNSWHDQDSQSTSWLQGLQSCPCSLSQALVDFGRWQPDDGCRLTNKGKATNCALHKGAEHCVRSVQPVGAAGNQCCYTAAGTLMYAADTFQGSTADRSHSWGAVPYGKPDYVPAMSHGIHDVIPFFHCCVWTEFGPDCDKYMDLRPTIDCTGYTPPTPASIFGQGHVKTFTDVDYRMFGPGTYILVVAGNTVIQGKLERNPVPTENNDTISGTVVLTGVAVQDRGTQSDTVEIGIRLPPADRDTQRLDVRVNGETTMFDNGAMAWQDFKGVTVVNTDIKQLKQSNFTIIMANGIGLQVAELQESNVLQLDVMIPNVFNNVSGLLGDLNGNLTSFNGTQVDFRRMTLSTQYNMFQLSWAVNERDSVFDDFLPANHSFLGPVNLDPPELRGALRQRARSICGNDELCVYDYMHTKSRRIATSTNLATQRYKYLSRSARQVRSCGLLNVPRATKTSYNYVLGTKTTIDGCRVGSLSGDTTYTCVATSNSTQVWSPQVTATCEVPTDTANVGMIVGIVVAVVVVIVLAVVITLLVLRQRKRADEKNFSGQKRTGEPQNEKEMETLKTNV